MRKPFVKSPTRYELFVASLQPLLDKGATAQELYELVYRATSAQHGGQLTQAEAQETIYTLCGEPIPS